MAAQASDVTRLVSRPRPPPRATLGAWRSSWTATGAGPSARDCRSPTGHRAGTRALRRTVEAAIDLGVESLAVYAFSTENWSRPADEVDDLMEIFGETIERELPDLAEQGVRTRFIGRRDRAPAPLRAQMESLEARDRRERPARSSGSRSTTAAGPSSSTPRGASSRTASRADEVDEEALATRLYAPELPDPDLLIRTSGELRLSNFLLWQTRLRRARLRRHALARLRRATSCASALDEYASRRRRFGGRVSQLVSRVLVAVVGAAGRARRRLARRLVALRARARRGARRPARAVRDGRGAAAARPRRLRRARSRLCSAPSSAGPSGCSAAFMLTLFARVRPLRASRRRGSRRRSRSASTVARRRRGSALGLGHLLLLRDLPEHGRLAIFTVLIAVFADDTAAYFVGRLVGRHKLAPTISPGKTWEGFVAGTVAAVAVAFFALYEQDFLSISQALVLGAAIARRGAARRPVRVGAQARHAGEGLRQAPRRPRRHARPDRRAPLRSGRGVLRACSRSDS